MAEQPHDLGDVLERALAEIAAGGQPERHSEEAELHAPMELRREPVEVDPETAAVLRERLGSGPGE